MSLTRKQILVIEDDDGNRGLIRELLILQNYGVVEAKSGRQALNLLESCPVDLILMDISLPDMTGLDVTRQIREQKKISHIPIIALTAHVRKVDQEAAFAAGATSHIPKPVNIQFLLSEIQKQLAV